MLEGSNYGTVIMLDDSVAQYVIMLDGSVEQYVIMLDGSIAQYVIMLEDANYGTMRDCAAGYYITMCDHAEVLTQFSFSLTLNVRFTASSKRTCLHVLPAD
jgi:endoglucanase Acf2